MQAQSIPISKIVPNSGQVPGLPKNPRIIKDEKYQKLVRSIVDDPEMLDLRELIVYPFDGTFVVIAGNMRLKALQELQYETAPCKVLPESTSIEKLKAYTIKDNVAFGENDWDDLANEWDVDQLEGWGVDIPGFVANPDEFGDGFSLKDGDKPPFQQMTFTFANAQAERVNEALGMVIVSDGSEYGNENGNGNKLHQIILEWVEQRKLS
jgi:hypothetical protein